MKESLEINLYWIKLTKWDWKEVLVLRFKWLFLLLFDIFSKVGFTAIAEIVRTDIIVQVINILYSNDLNNKFEFTIIFWTIKKKIAIT